MIIIFLINAVLFMDTYRKYQYILYSSENIYVCLLEQFLIGFPADAVLFAA